MNRQYGTCDNRVTCRVHDIIRIAPWALTRLANVAQERSSFMVAEHVLLQADVNTSSTSTCGVKDVSKLTVPQLKALCKELKLTGYSKLGKGALLQKLSEATANGIQATVNACSSTSLLLQRADAFETTTADVRSKVGHNKNSKPKTTLTDDLK